MTGAGRASTGIEGLHVERWGSGTPIVMIHGGGQGHLAGGREKWRYQRPLTERGYELVVPDRPGSGRSPSRGPEDFRDDAPWVVELLGAGAHLVGHSYGGAISMCAAGLRPQAVRSLTLIEPPVLSVAMDQPPARKMALQVKAAATSRVPLAGMVRAMKLLGIPRGLEPRPSLKELRAMGGGFRTMAHPYEWDAGEAVAAVAGAAVPTLFVDGGWSRAMAGNCDVLARLTGGRRVTLGAGHHLPHMVDEGAEFNVAYEQFLTDVEPAD